MIYDAGFGYATRLLGYWVREKQIMTVEEAVRKLTFMVASIFGLPDRGLLRRGMAADVAIFDPATVREGDAEMVQDLPGNERRFIQKATGIEMTIVNGQVLVEKDCHTGALPGSRARRRQRSFAASSGVGALRAQFKSSIVQRLFRNRNLSREDSKFGLLPILPRDAGEDRGEGLNRA